MEPILPENVKKASPCDRSEIIPLLWQNIRYLWLQ